MELEKGKNMGKMNIKINDNGNKSYYSIFIPSYVFICELPKFLKKRRSNESLGCGKLEERQQREKQVVGLLCWCRASGTRLE